MKKAVQDLKQKSIKELELEVLKLREEIAKNKMDRKVNPTKDTNIISNKRRRLALLQTLVTQNREDEKKKS